MVSTEGKNLSFQGARTPENCLSKILHSCYIITNYLLYLELDQIRRNSFGELSALFLLFAPDGESHLGNVDITTKSFDRKDIF